MECLIFNINPRDMNQYQSTGYELKPMIEFKANYTLFRSIGSKILMVSSHQQRVLAAYMLNLFCLVLVI